MDSSQPALPAAAMPVDEMPGDEMPAIEMPDKVQIIHDIILEAVNNKYNWQAAKLLLSKFKKFAANREMTLNDMRDIGINAARSYTDFKHIKITKGHYNYYYEPTDLYHNPIHCHNTTGFFLRIDESGNVIIRLKEINPIILDIISCVGPVYIEITQIRLNVLPAFPDNVISININIDTLKYGHGPITVNQFPSFLRTFACNITISNNFVNMIPATIEFLQITKASQYLDLYPNGLKTFIYSGNNFTYYGMAYERCISRFGILPYGLTKFSIDGVFAMPFSEVPHTVEFMYIRELYEPLLNLPCGLKILAIANVYQPRFCPREHFRNYSPGEIQIKTNWELKNEDYGDYSCNCAMHKSYVWNPKVIMFNDGLECLALGRRNIVNILLPNITELPPSFKKLLIPQWKADYSENGIRYTTTIDDFIKRFPDIIIEHFSSDYDLYQVVNAY